MSEAEPYMGEEYLFPLSFQQARLWFLEQLDPANAAYNMPITLRLDGALRTDALVAAFQHVVDRHEALRTRFERDSQVQVVAESWTISPTLVDLSGLPDGHRERELARVKLEVVRRPFDLWSAPPLRVVVVRVSPEEHVLLLVIHHIVCDGWSLGVLARELSIAYSAWCDGLPPELPELPVQYGDFALWQRDRLSGEGLREELEHWSGVLVGAPAAIELPTDHPRPPDPSYQGGRVRHGLAEPLAARLEQVAQAHGASLFMVVLAAYGIVLSRMSGRPDVVVGTATAGRSRPETEGLVGCFIDVVPLRVDLSGDPAAGELLARVRRTCLDAFAHQDLPFERLVEHLQPERDLSRTPVFQVMLNGQDTLKHDLSWPGVEVTGENPEPGLSKYDLTLDVHREGSGLLLDLEFSRDVFERESAQRLVERVGTVLAWLAEADPEAPVAGADVVSAAERAWLREAGSGPSAAVPEGSAAEVVLAGRPSGRVAVAGGERPQRSLSYARVEEVARRVAAALVARGVRRGDAVGIMLPRSPMVVPALLGVWLAGASCVPLEARPPAGRLRLVAADCGMRLLLTCAEAAAGLTAPGLETLHLEDVPAEETGRALPADLPGRARREEAGRTLPAGLSGRDRAYVAYPSGPPGLLVPHEAVVNALSSIVAEPGLAAQDVVLAATPLTLAGSLPELLAPLLAGARVVVATEAQAADPMSLAKLIEECGATVAGAAPETWRMLLDSGWRPVRPLRIWSCGDVPLTDLEVSTLYGPAGAPVSMVAPSGATPPEADEHGTAPPRTAGHRSSPGAGERGAGRPVANTELFVLDPRMRPVPAGVAGELYIGGTGVADGYLGRPALTAERFPPSPFAPGRRLFRTGEAARVTSGGSVSLTGAAERTAPERGGRIEPPAPAAERAPGERVAPHDALESLVLGCVRRVLDKPGLGVTDDFFEHGGSSMSAMKLALDIEQATGYRPGLRDLFRDSTAAGLAARVRTRRATAGPEEISTGPTHESRHD
ncbi:hypothetical protein GCM10022226_40940 [Sphaerisporangium flaviroseum]|uniref:Carrier domain-containing protein n=1 Tax=Sphaerisporangium flaviroseum TaxID=509199 RepID=A0ABP7IE36_9ACTN